MTRMRRWSVLALFVAVALVFSVVRAQSREDVALRTAIETETIKGDLKSAIGQFQKLSESTDRTVAATALLHLAACYEKLGQADAKTVYARVAQQFADTQLAGEATRKLSDLDAGRKSTLSTELVASFRDDRGFGQTVSRDGRYLPSLRNGRILIVDLQTGTDRVVPGIAASPLPEIPLISPDGKWIVYSILSDPRRVRIIGIDGANGRDLVTAREGMSGPAALDWSRDGGSILVVFNTLAAGRGSAQARPRPAELQLVSVQDGSVKASFKFDHALDTARLSPDGRQIAFASIGGGVSVLTVSTGAAVTVVDSNASEPMWTPDGSRVIFSRLRRTASSLASDLWFVRITNGKADGAPEFFRKDVRAGVPTGDGGYLYRTANSTRDIYAVDIDPESGRATGAATQLTSMDDSRAPAWSPDGQRFAFVAMGSPNMGVNARLAVQDPRTPGQLQFLDPEQNGAQSQVRPQVPQWFPDGRSILVLHANGALGRVDVETRKFTPVLPGVQVPVDLSGTYANRLRMSHDGHYLYYVAAQNTGETRRIARLNLENGQTSDVVRLAARGLVALAVSPDDKQLAFVAGFNVTGNPPPDRAIMVVPVDGGEPRQVYRTSETSIYDLVWGQDGRRLYYTSGVNRWKNGVVIEQGADIWTVTIDGRDARPLGLHLSDEYYINIHPNGRQLIWMEENYRNELWMLRLPASK